MSGSYHCKVCGWSRIILDWETIEDAQRNHELTDVHKHGDITGPGKFEGNASLTISEYLYGIVNSSGADEFFGSVDENGWFGIIRFAENGYTGHVPIAHHYIVNEDSNGFFTYTAYDNLDEVNAAWHNLIDEYAKDDEIQPRCDICHLLMEDNPGPYVDSGAWNGETGNHIYCEELNV